MKYSDWLSRWLEQYAPTMKASTQKRYSVIIRNQIIPQLGEIELNKLTDTKLKQFVAELSASCSVATLKGVIGVVNRSLSGAKTRGLPVKCGEVKLPVKRKTVRKIKSLSQSNQKRLEAFVDANPKTKLYGIIISLYTGLRIGELLALEWSDIDFKACTLTVSKNCGDSYVGGKYEKYIDTPKTISSQREIPLPRQLLPKLRQLKKQSVSKYVVEGKNGKAMSIRSYQCTFDIVTKRLNLQGITFHCLRHTFVTRALECGVDIKTISEILGHSDPSITLKYYSHCLPEHKTAMMNRIGKFLQAGK